MKKILVTGFEPFGGGARNPSREIALALHDRIICGRRVIGAVLPCVFARSIAELKMLLRVHRPELVVAFGVAGDRAAITPEQSAANFDDAHIPDNTGAQPIEQPVIAGGPDVYRTTLPIRAMTASLRKFGLPAEISQTAGTFVCNHLFYGLMHELRDTPEVRGGFIHVPFDTPALPFSSMVEGLSLALESALPAHARR